MTFWALKGSILIRHKFWRITIMVIVRLELKSIVILLTKSFKVLTAFDLIFCLSFYEWIYFSSAIAAYAHTYLVLNLVYELIFPILAPLIREFFVIDKSVFDSCFIIECMFLTKNFTRFFIYFRYEFAFLMNLFLFLCVLSFIFHFLVKQTSI